jgi:5'-nucleotidase
METRRSFIKKAGAASLLTLVPGADLLAGVNDSVKKITILHTNDQHSRIEPFEVSTNEKLSNKGGFARRAKLLQTIRQQEKNILLLDAGDAFQGTPYFNMFGGELEFKLMSKMGYDVMTLGNHEFDNGLEGIKRQFPHKNFPIINANYDFRNTILDGMIKPYEIFWREGVKIGVFGLGVNLTGLVSNNAFGEIKFLDSFEISQEYVRILREQEKCDIVICLSHLGYEYSDVQSPSDVRIAQETSGIDLIIGGHTHTFLERPREFINAKGQTVLVNQVGYAGLFLGRIDVYIRHGKVVKTTAYNLSDYAIDERIV